MVGGDRRSPPPHKAKGGGGKGKGSGRGDELGVRFDSSVKCSGAKLSAKNGEEFRFGGCIIDGNLQQVTGNTIGVQDDMKLDGANCMIPKPDVSLNDSIGSLVNSELQSGPHLASAPFTFGNTSWALAVEACEALERDRKTADASAGSAYALENENLHRGEVLQRISQSALPHTKSSDASISDSQQANTIARTACKTAHDRDLIARTAGMDCNDHSHTSLGVSNGAVHGLLEVANGTMGCWKSEKSGEIACADSIVSHGSHDCTQGVCRLASTGQCAANAYAETGQYTAIACVKNGLMDGRISATHSSSTMATAGITYVNHGILDKGKTAICSSSSNKCPQGVWGNAASSWAATTDRPSLNTKSLVHLEAGNLRDRLNSLPQDENMEPIGEATCLPRPRLVNAWNKPIHVKVSSLVLGNITNDGLAVAFDRITYERNKGKLQNGLVGKLIGRRLPLHILDRELSRRWGHVGGFRTVLIGGDCFLCIFESLEARDQILMGGPWQIMGHIIGMDRWTPEFNPDSLNGLSSPVWVRLPRLPLLFWDNITIGRIATMLGEPLWIDALTTEWGRSEYARICIRLDLSKKLPTGVWIEGERDRFFQPVEYEGISLLCFHCGVIGHKVDLCPRIHGHPQQRPKPKPVHIREPNGGGCTTDRTPMVVADGESCHQKEGIQHVSTDLNKGEVMAQSPSGSEDCDAQDTYGPWILVTRKKRPTTAQNRMKQNPAKGPVRPLVRKTTAPSIVENNTSCEDHGTGTSLESSLPAFTEEQVKTTLAIEDKMIECSKDMMISLEKGCPSSACTTPKLPHSRSGKSRVSKAHFEKELLQLGPIALKSRKRKKQVSVAGVKQCLKEFKNMDDKSEGACGGDASPSDGK